MEKVIELGGIEIGLKATGLTPKLYRHWIGRDMIRDMATLRKAYAKRTALPEDATEDEKQDAQFSVLDLEIFENAAWVMARQYNPEIEKTPDEWLDTLPTFGIYEVLPTILELWRLNTVQTSAPKKN